MIFSLVAGGIISVILNGLFGSVIGIPASAAGKLALATAAAILAFFTIRATSRFLGGR